MSPDEYKARTGDAAALRVIDEQKQIIAQLTRDIETGFMQGAYARLQNLQAAERELDELKSNIKTVKDACADLILVTIAFAKERGTPREETATDPLFLSAARALSQAIKLLPDKT